MSEYEKVLLTKARKGDANAFEMLIMEHERKAYNIAYRFLKNPEDAEDITQEAFLRAFRNIKKFKGQSSFSTWLYRIINNTCIDFVRSKQNKNVDSIDKTIRYEGEELELQIPSDENDPVETVETIEISELMKSMLDQLPDDQKMALVLRDIQGFSYQEIVDITGVGMGTVKSRINRGRIALKELIEQKGELFSDYIVK
ncbi:MAG TPA: RNA polymerase subunit sigma-24 [Clostridiales bacterium]|nr:RNA polymerase subunit sigma-24 [Clostridiales bacterium]